MLYTPGQTTTSLRAIVADRYSSAWDVREADSELARRELAVEAVYGDPVQGPELEGLRPAATRPVTMDPEPAHDPDAVVRHPFGVGRAAPLPSTLVPAPGGCIRCLTPAGPRNVHAGWCRDAEILRAAPAFDETDPATWSVPTGRGNEVIENLPACYAWVPVVEAGVETGELHLIAPNGRNLSRAVAEAEAAARDEARALEAEALRLADEADEDDEDGCEGHETLAGAHMGETVYCSGECVPRGRDAVPGLFG